jgi:hypothetical protein
MMTGRSKQFVSALLVFAISIWPLEVFADTQWVTISATVPTVTPPGPTLPIVQLSGISAPGATVTITRDGTLLTTLVSGAGADYSVILGTEPIGQHEYLLAAEDESGGILGSQTLALNLQSGSTTIVSGIFLGPSIAIDKTEVELGQSVTLSGQTAPGSSVTVTVSSTQALDFSVVAASDGTWTRVVNTESVGTGQHSAKARAVTTGNTISAYSPSVSFLVNPFDPATGKEPSDINTDGSSNLIDLSILLFFWHTSNPSNPRADINHDGFVDIIDFSILLFQWTG